MKRFLPAILIIVVALSMLIVPKLYDKSPTVTANYKYANISREITNFRTDIGQAIVNGWYMSLACLNRPFGQRFDMSMIVGRPDTTHFKFVIVDVASKFFVPTVQDSVVGLSDWTPYQANIYVAQPSAIDPVVWAHEFSHVLLNTSEHPESIFKRCGLYE